MALTKPRGSTEVRSLRDGLFCRSRLWLPLEIESGPARGAERQVLNGARRANLGQSLNVVEDRLDFVGALGLTSQDQHLHRQDPFRLEPQRNVQKPRERAQQQARS